MPEYKIVISTNYILTQKIRGVEVNQWASIIKNKKYQRCIKSFSSYKKAMACYSKIVLHDFGVKLKYFKIDNTVINMDVISYYGDKGRYFYTSRDKETSSYLIKNCNYKLKEKRRKKNGYKRCDKNNNCRTITSKY